VIIPVYNGQATIGRAIDSALAQAFDGFEVIVVNDGSTDNTNQILESYGAKILVVNHQSNRGLSAARNTGVSQSRGEYLAFLDDDDIWRADKLAQTLRALDQHSEAVLCFSDFEMVEANGKQIKISSVGRPPTMEDLLSGAWPILPSAVVMKRSVFDLCGGFNQGLRWFEDTFMWLQAREHGEFVFVAEPLVIYRYADADVVARTEKYEPGRLELRRLLLERYGMRASALIASFDRGYYFTQMMKARRQLDAGDYRGAFNSLMKAAKSRPTYIIQRILRPSNVARLFRMCWGSSATRNSPQ